MKYELEEFKYLQNDLVNKIYMTNYEQNTVDYVQFGRDWLKYRFSKGRKTFILTEDDLKAVADFTKFNIKRSEFGAALAEKLKLDVKKVRVKTPDYRKDELIQAAKGRFEQACNMLGDPNAKQQPAFIGMLDSLHALLLMPFTASGMQAVGSKYVQIDGGMSGAFYPTGLNVPGTDIQIWEKAIDPLCWYGKPVLGKPVSSLSEVNNYDAPLGNLEELIQEERS